MDESSNQTIKGVLGEWLVIALGSLLFSLSFLPLPWQFFGIWLFASAVVLLLMLRAHFVSAGRSSIWRLLRRLGPSQ